MARSKTRIPRLSTIHWFPFLSILVVIVGIQTTSIYLKPINCSAGHFLYKDPETSEEKCMVCENMTYMPEENHRKTACYHCDEDPLSGEWKQVNRPCTWKSNTEIGCQSQVAYRIESRRFVCKPCTVCGEGEVETVYCTEYTNRVCKPKKETPKKCKKCNDDFGSNTNATSRPTWPPPPPPKTTSTPKRVTKPAGKAGKPRDDGSDQSEGSNANIVFLVLIFIISTVHCLYSLREPIKEASICLHTKFRNCIGCSPDDGEGVYRRPGNPVPYESESEQGL